MRVEAASKQQEKGDASAMVHCTQPHYAVIIFHNDMQLIDQ